jgi:hypothetical protein
MQVGERIIIHTPGGGGYGSLEGEAENKITEASNIVPAALIPGRKTFPRANGSLSEYAATQQSCD